MANCSIGFGKNSMGGKKGKIYVLDDPSADAVNPKISTLTYGVSQDEPLWIVFATDMVIKLQQKLMTRSLKTIDGRGTDVHIAEGSCFVYSSDIR